MRYGVSHRDAVHAAAAQSCLAPGLPLFRRYLEDAAQQALAREIAEPVLQASWFVPRMPRWVKRSRSRIAVASDGCPTAMEAIVIRRPIRLPDLFGPHPFVRSGDMARVGLLCQDRDEAELAAPVVSISLGDRCCFRDGGSRRGDPAKKLELCSGAERFAGSSGLLPGGGRINLTLRRVTRP
jgi:alkylated DNA repair protein (DNA oxidative demethylase)